MLTPEYCCHFFFFAYSNLNRVLYTTLDSVYTMVGGTLGPLTATEARAFNDVVGEFGASDGGV